MSHLQGHSAGNNAWALTGGVTLFLVASAAAVLRSSRRWLRGRLVAAAALVAVSPLLAKARPLAALAAVVIFLTVLGLWENYYQRRIRRDDREGPADPAHSARAAEGSSVPTP